MYPPRQISRTGTIEKHLRMREMGFGVKVLLTVIVGVPLVFVGPAVLSFMVANPGRWSRRMGLEWDVVIGPICLIVIPILFLLEWGTGGRFIENAFDEGRLGTRSSGSSRPWRNDGNADGAVFFLGLLLLGPRLIRTAIQEFIKRRRLKPINPKSAAVLLTQLLAADGGIEVKFLSASLPGEVVNALEDCIAYLMFFDWVDRSADGKIVWMRSPSRAELDLALK